MTGKRQETTDFATQDLYLAGALVVAGGQLLDIALAGENGRVAWIFKRDEPLSSAIEHYWTRELRVDALTFGEKLRNLKAQTFSVRGRG